MGHRDHIDDVVDHDEHDAVGEASHLRRTNIRVDQQGIAQRRFSNAAKRDIHGFDETSSPPGVVFLVVAKI